VGNLRTVLFVVHHKQFKLRNVGDKEFKEPVGKSVTGSLIGTVTNLHHRDRSLKPAADRRINTLWFAPVRVLNSHEAVAEMACEFLRPLFDNLWFNHWSDLHLAGAPEFTSLPTLTPSPSPNKQ